MQLALTVLAVVAAVTAVVAIVGVLIDRSVARRERFEERR
jgi:hypothetical protein